MVIGGYGGFGGRLSRRLAAAGRDVLVAGRDLMKAERFCADSARCRSVVFDRRCDPVPLLATHRPALVIDAAGPFQGCGYDLPAACIAARVPYLDLADGRAFVTGIGVLDSDAREAGVAVLSGASSVPALSGAVVRHLAEGLDRVSTIELAISASNRATAGQSVAAAILGTVGQPLRLWSGGRWRIAYGWQDPRREHMAMTRGRSIGARWVALADVPDLDLLPQRVSGQPAVTFRAGTELFVQKAALWLASWAVRWRWLRSLSGLAGALLPLQRLTAPLGTDHSGMVVRVFGWRGAERLERRWTLIAGDGDGPEIPTLAAALLAERILAGHVQPGVRDAGEELSLADFAPVFAKLSIEQETREIARAEPLYRRVLRKRFGLLPPAVASLHSALRDGGAEGRAVVTRGRNPVAQLAAKIVGFPPAGEHPLHVSFDERGGVERWTRDFSGRLFTSHLTHRGGRLVERFGLLRFRFDLPADEQGLQMVRCGWSCLSLPLPLALGPRPNAKEWEENDCFNFNVSISLPIVELIVRYSGWLRLI